MGGTGGVASGGQTNINGENGSNGTGAGTMYPDASTVNFAGGTGGSPAHADGNTGGAGGSAIRTIAHNGSSGSAGFVKISRGDTNITA